MNQHIFNELVSHSKEIALWSSMLSLLDWDQETYMPPAGIDLRGEQKKALAALIHQKRKDPIFNKQLGSLIDLSSGEIKALDLSPRQQAALRAWHSDLKTTLSLPDSLVDELALITTAATHAWAQAREQADFSYFAPHLDKIIALKRDQCAHLGFTAHPYDALLNLYEPGMSVAKLDPLFERLKKELSPIVKSLPSETSSFHVICTQAAKLRHFCHNLLTQMGFDFTRGRLDTTEHPFCIALSPNDLRLTTQNETSNVLQNIMTALHEGGHGLYEQGLRIGDFGTPLAEAASTGIHESQSRFWETRIGLSLPFWTHYFPLLQKLYPDQLGERQLTDFYETLCRPKASLIRVHADELSYCLHIIVRYELEKALIEGSLPISKLPEAFSDKMESYLGIRPSNDREGCLQDIHWAAGLFGYFPTYALGNLYAAQLFETFEKELPDWELRVAKGNLSFIREWLDKKIYCYGREYLPDALIHKVTEHTLSCEPYIHYLKEKFASHWHPLKESSHEMPLS